MLYGSLPSFCLRQIDVSIAAERAEYAGWVFPEYPRRGLSDSTSAQRKILRAQQPLT